MTLDGSAMARRAVTAGLGLAFVGATLGGAAVTAHAADPLHNACVVWSNGTTYQYTFQNQYLSSFDNDMHIVQGQMALTPDETQIVATLVLAHNSGGTLGGSTSTDYYMDWQYGGTTYFAHASVHYIDPSGNPTGGLSALTDTVTYSDGTVDGSGNRTDLHTDTGIDQYSTDQSQSGYIRINVPRKNVGNPPATAVLLQPTGYVYAGESFEGQGLPQSGESVNGTLLLGGQQDKGGPTADWQLNTGCVPHQSGHAQSAAASQSAAARSGAAHTATAGFAARRLAWINS